MPIVAPVPIGNNTTLIRGLDDRLADMEARRTEFGGGVAAATATLPDAQWVFPPSWPVVTKATPNGAAMLQFGYQNPQGDFTTGNYQATGGYSVDNGTPVAVYTEQFANSQSGLITGPFWIIPVMGLSAGWHTFQIAVFVSWALGDPSAEVLNPFLVVWPL